MKLREFAPYLALAWLIGLGAFLRLHGLNAYYFSPDDCYDLWISGQPTMAAVWQLGANEPHPPLLYVVLHAMLLFTRNDLLLRGVSLAPGLALIPAVFFLGRKASGTVSGLAMAFMTSFGYAAILMSESIRRYGVIALCMAGALHLYCAYQDDGRPRHLYGLAALLAVALLFEYAIAIFVAALGITWLASLLLKRKPAREYARAALAFLPFALSMVFLYRLHLSELFASKRFANPVEAWNARFFFNDWPGLVSNLRDLFGYFFLPPNAPWTGALAVAGCAALGRHKRLDLAAMALIALGINIIFTMHHKYPLGGSRHSYYLFVPACLLIGATLQYAYDAASQALRAGRGRGLHEWLARRETPLIILSLLCLLGAGLAVARDYAKSDELRRYSGKSTMELPVKRGDYLWAWDYIRTNAGPDDHVLVSYQSAIYIFYSTLGEARAVQVGGPLHQISYLGRDFYFIKQGSSGWNFDTDRVLAAQLAILCKSVPVKEGSRVWIMNVGWAPELKFLSSDPFWRRLGESRFALPGAAIYSLDAAEVKNALASAPWPAARHYPLAPRR